MSQNPTPASKRKADPNLEYLYWLMRIGMAIIWIWTALASWFFYPHSESLDWLRRLGLSYQTYFVFAGACLLDLFMGIASALFARRIIWQSQLFLVIAYTFAVAIGLPEFLIHPFGPVTKNIAVVACLSYLITMETR